MTTKTLGGKSGFKRRFKDLVLVSVEVDEEDRSTYSKEWDINAIIEIIADRWISKSDSYFSWNRLETEDQVRHAMTDSLEWARGVFTKEVWDARQAAEEREELEGLMADIARRHEVQSVYSLEIFAAIESELERFQEYRHGLKEDRLCIGWGVTSEQWFDEFNASQGDTAKIHRLLDWIEKNLPLLWASWMEAKASGSKVAE